MDRSITTDQLLALVEGRLPDAQLAALPPLEEYLLLRTLGSGAMGRVFLARDTLLDRMVAIKFLLRQGTDAQAKERFMVEARAIARLSHTNVVGVYRAAEIHGHLFLVSEYVAGQSLDRLAKPVPSAKLLEIARALFRGLAAAHRQGVLHRDLKPANAILTEDGTAKLLDFGLAKLEALTPKQPAAALDATLPAPDQSPSPHVPFAGAQRMTQTGALIGTPLYMAPELWRGVPATVTSDLYSMGALLFELGAGRPPHLADSITSLCLAAQERDAPVLSAVVPAVDRRLSEVVDRCLRRNPADRPASAEEILLVLDQHEDRPRSTVQNTDVNPYRGLYAFEIEDSALFYGRSREVGELLSRLRAEPMVLVAGDSGIGKSSLCRAGVLARVEAGGLTSEKHLRTLTLFPGRRPVVGFCDALSEWLQAPSASLQAALREAPAEFARRLQRRARGQDGLFLFIDQLEELLSQSVPDEAALIGEFLGHLAGARVPGLRVLMTARGDFLTRLAALPGLGEAMTRILYLLRPLGREHLRDVIVQPASASGIRFESEHLIDDLIDSTLRTDGGLPLLQFALAELWEARDTQQKLITASALARIGGVEGALARHADRILEALLPAQRHAAQRMLITLVTAAGLRIRRTAEELLLQPTDAIVAEALVRGRLLMVRGAGEQSVYEIAHEALLKGWSTLRRWLESELERREVRERVESAAAEWRRLAKAPEALWDRRRIFEVSKVQIEEAHLPAAAREFLAASRRWVTRQRRIRLGLLIGAPMLILLAYAGARAWVAHERAGRVDQYVHAAQEPLTAARALNLEVEALRKKSFAAFDARSTDEEGERLWAQIIALQPKTLNLYAQASQSLELAATVDSDRGDVRDILATVLYERALIAEREFDKRQLAELLDRLAVHDITGVWRRKWDAGARVKLRTQPAGVRVTVAQYQMDVRGRQVLLPAQELGTTPLDTVLKPGSYLLVLSAEGHETIRYPLLAHHAANDELDILVPGRGQLPPNFVYIPPGRFLFGASTEETLRKGFYTTCPLHELRTGGYLIGQNEVTFKDWIDYLSALPIAERTAHGPRGSPISAVNSASLIQLPDGWQLTLKSGKREFVARSGEPIVYAGRANHTRQDWLRMPVMDIKFRDAVAYVRWLAETGRVPRARLCTEYEWERAARGADDRVYPHGNKLEPEEANYSETYGKALRLAGSDEVGSHPASRSPFGLDDMCGNAIEWTLPSIGRLGEELVVRGGSFFLFDGSVEIFNRLMLNPDYQDEGFGLGIGLRVCADFPIPEAPAHPSP